MSCNHDALKSDPVAWLRLAYVGRQFTPADDFGPAETLELRNCGRCHSTLCVVNPDPSPQHALHALDLDHLDLKVMQIEFREALAARTAEILVSLGAADEELHVARAA